MGKRNFSKSSGATTYARAVPVAGFKNCCMLTGEFDGSNRHHFFSGVTLLSNLPVNADARAPAVLCKTRRARSGYRARSAAKDMP